MVINNFIELKNINFFYKKKNFILNDLNIKIYGGKITALLGINGSGKTTLFKVLTGIVKPNSGSLFYNNVLINDDNLYYYKKDLGFMPESLQFYNNMTVKDVLNFLSDLKGYNNLDLKDVLNMVFLLEHSNKKIKALSKGMKQRLNLAQAIIGNPKIILFDEPSNGFDCGSITMFYNILKYLSDRGAIVLISSHHLTEIYGNVDNVLVLSNGYIIKEIDINSFNLNNNILFKEVFILINDFIDDVSLLLLHKKFPNINVKNFNIFYGKVNSKTIIDLILFLSELNFSIKDIRIDNKILEDILIKLS